MGAGASTLPATLDKATAKEAAGDKFDEAAFDAAAVDGVITPALATCEVNLTTRQ